MNTIIRHFAGNDFTYRQPMEWKIPSNALEALAKEGSATRNHLLKTYYDSAEGNSSIFAVEERRGNTCFASAWIDRSEAGAIFIIYAHAACVELADRMLAFLVENFDTAPKVPAWETGDYAEVLDRVFGGDETARNELRHLRDCIL